MARRSSSKKAKTVKVDFSNVGKQFEAEMEYFVEVKVCTLEAGNEYPYLAFQLGGEEGSDFENSIMYHNASTSPQSLWRLKPLLEAMGFDVGDDEFEIDPDDYVGKKFWVATAEEKKQGGSTAIRPVEFWSEDDADSKGGDKEDDDAGDLSEQIDALDDADVLKLAKKLGIKTKKAKDARKAILEEDEDDVREAAEELDITLGEAEEEEKPAKGKAGKESKAGSGKSSKSSKKKEPDLTEDEVQGMNEDELQETIDQHDLDVDLDDHKTLRKKKVAVIDALQEAGIIE